MTAIEIAQRCKAILSAYYGVQFGGLVVFGSTARQQAGPESDLDLLVLLTRPFDYFAELRRIVELLYPVQLESEQLISAKPAPLEAFEQGTLQLYRNARHEGQRL